MPTALEIVLFVSVKFLSASYIWLRIQFSFFIKLKKEEWDYGIKRLMSLASQLDCADNRMKQIMVFLPLSFLSLHETK